MPNGTYEPYPNYVEERDDGTIDLIDQRQEVALDFWVSYIIVIDDHTGLSIEPAHTGSSLGRPALQDDTEGVKQ
jgi:hypothetical protein